MSKILIIWGGWEGHYPEEVANQLKEELCKLSYQVTITGNIGVLLNQSMKAYDLIIPIWSCGIQSDIYLSLLLDLISDGTGLVTFHGGINWFDQTDYETMIGGKFINDSNIDEFKVKMTDDEHEITKACSDFYVSTEPYYIETHDNVHILAVGDYPDVEVPVMWTKTFGKGRIFYSALAHEVDQVFKEDHLKIILRAIKYCSRR